MRYLVSLALAVTAASAVSVSNQNHRGYSGDQIAVQEQFLVELGPGETIWITEEQKWELKRVCCYRLLCHSIPLLDAGHTNTNGLIERSEVYGHH